MDNTPKPVAKVDEERLHRAIQNLNVILIGDSTDLFEVRTLSKVLGISMLAAKRTLRDLQVGVIYIGDREYFRVSALDEALFAMSEWGAPGFAAPGSKRKWAQYRHGAKYPPREAASAAQVDEYFKTVDRDALHKRMANAAKTRGRTVGSAVKRLSRLVVKKTEDLDDGKPASPDS